MDKMKEITNFLDEAVKRILPVTNITSLVMFARLAGLQEMMAGHISLKCTQQSWNIQTARTLTDSYFTSWFAEAECIANQVGAAVDFPRISAIQTKRSNAPANTAHKYYKRNAAILFLDHLLSKISVRFSDKHAIAYIAISIIPAVMKQQSESTGCKRHHSSLSQDFRLEIGMPEVTSSEDFSMSSITSLVKIQRIDKPWKSDLLSFCQQYEHDLPTLPYWHMKLITD